MAKLLDGIRTVFFDLGDTLAYSTHTPLEIWLAAASDQDIRLRKDALLRAMTEADQAYNPRFYEFKGRIEEYWRLYDQHVISSLGLADKGKGLSQAVEIAFLDTKRWMAPFPETHFVLTALRQKGLDLGIISNNTDEMPDRMNDLDLLKYFRTVTYSQEAGAEKPAPEPFRLALKRTGRKPEQCIHVGNSLEQDVAGARGVGIAPVLLDREGKH
ncbi:MAG TPA: HAD family hydrolase, partial [Nitrososphaerales archaeon]|nr:HAD family hydrolase [Nitrososphaerales archaeon]